MKQPSETKKIAPTNPGTGVSGPEGLRRFWPVALGLAVCFFQPLHELIKLSLRDDLYSHVPLIPLVSFYLIWSKRRELPEPSLPNRTFAGALAVLGLATLMVSVAATQGTVDRTTEDMLFLRILAFLFFLVGTAAWTLGKKTLGALAFPFALLIFILPFPTIVRNGLETFLQYGSAAVAHSLFKLSDTSVFYHDLIFRLPGINLQVAPECSGIRSSLALFITSVVAGHFFLRSRWKCALLSLAVIPLALLRNGFRIFTIGELCVHISPDMINSYIHRQGGPVFFALSLIPFFLLLWLLLRSEQRPHSPSPTIPPQ